MKNFPTKNSLIRLDNLSESQIIEALRAGTLLASDDCVPKLKYLTWGEAVEALRDGKLVARLGWSGAGIFIYLVPAEMRPITREDLKGLSPDGMILHREHFVLKTANGDMATWAPSVSDSLASDYFIYKCEQ